MKRFNFDSPKPATQTAAPKPPKYPGVKRDHILMIGHIWLNWVPILDPEITPEIAAQVWAHFVSSPSCRSHDVIAMRVYSNRVWSRWIEMN